MVLCPATVLLGLTSVPGMGYVADADSARPVTRVPILARNNAQVKPPGAAGLPEMSPARGSPPTRCTGLSGRMAAVPDHTKLSADLFDRASAVTPGGVNSPVRAFRAVGGVPRFMASGDGCHITDVDGNTYVDLVCSWGPMLLGHAHPEVTAAVQATVSRGTSYGTPTETEVLLAEEIVGRTPVDKVRLVSSGTEATMSALRLARGFTGRDKIVKFAGCYHGHVDALLAQAGSGVITLGIPGTPGVTEATTADTIVLPYNDQAAVTAGVRAVRRPDRRGDHRGLAGQHGRRPAAGQLQRLPRQDLQGQRRAVHLRRGDDRLPDHQVRLVRRGHRHAGAGPDDVRQGDGRRLPGGGLRRPGRHRWRISRPRARSTRPARCRGTRSPPRPGWPRCDWRPTRSTPSSTQTVETITRTGRRRR